ncbi:Rieske 2Fe-2S domain-containing protein [Planktomarina sp.]|jgi:phenylpropionate dioxygenase-like ring-hydroxylating dioxygenase large terminal subunit|nr:Rieske 2Fe-2S domain-containing protein [Planktomarina sp.]
MTQISGQIHIDDILSRLSMAATTPLSQTVAMPPEMYHNDYILKLEQDKIFRNEWICVGRTGDVPNTGDYLTWHIQDQPILVVRQPDGSIGAYSNTCRHRMMRLLEGQGTCKRIVCPYHAWTYDLSGQLIGAPYMDRTVGFKKGDIKLPEIRSEIWEGWIYVTLNAQARPVKEKLANLHPLIAQYNSADYVSIVLKDVEWKANWKHLSENFMEGYHLPVAHRATVGGFCPLNETEFPKSDSDENFTYQIYTKGENAPVGNAHPSNTSLKGKWRNTSVLPTVFPSHMFSLAPDHIWYLSIQPNGVDKVTIRHGAAIAPEVLENHPDPDAFLESTRKFLSQVQEEDRFVVEGLHEGSAAPLSEPGQLSWLEREVYDFSKYISQQLSSQAVK